ncbi:MULTISPECIES: Ger(x)C family spore germination protein [Brevibacillus]|uniref:Spore germination protein n=1 Tax=Brevibacillus borstelensis AK1 TaxID=1300222 RepID=M8E4W6_9BACL|nr:Ger(x)C family spore germination protein [Brevibacillus borstelensis]EMT54331.1 spore germination protein [Brevibacillus borstelensis AK1]KKX54077.1 spore gernimation protein [Brevibacillus borstelensis cifa_chp40]MED1746295.1 Ger(x)C family spore germination protein [Brevibacillus borstelensis]MED1852433.1 Ger(x)C family spore germination protein [Brevibacillus borstelensis]MED1882737.1 Ger(x)C family spore germination protein [Brevibacillus borstelensis]
MKRSSRFKIASIIVILIHSLLLTGCWDRVEVNDLALILAFAVDKEEDGLYRMSVQLPLVSSLGGPSGGGGGTSGDKSYYVDSATGKTLREANNVLQSRMSRKLFYAHHRVIVIGEETAKSGLREILDVIARFPENRLTAYMVVAKGKGFDLLKAQPQFERFSAEAMRELIKMVGVTVTVKDIAQMLNTPGVDAYLPVLASVDSRPKGKSKEIELIGFSMFRDDRFAHFLTLEHAKGIRWFQPTFYSYATDFDIRKNREISVQVNQGRMEITPIVRNGKVHFQINVHARAAIIEDHSGTDWGNSKNLRMLENKLAANISEGIRTTLQEMVKNQSDIAGLGLVLARKYPQLWKTSFRENWDKHLKAVTFEIRTRATVPNIGQTTENLTKEEMR